jgi:hypothetical protein
MDTIAVRDKEAQVRDALWHKEPIVALMRLSKYALGRDRCSRHFWKTWLPLHPTLAL